jgi:hypothetical protein
MSQDGCSFCRSRNRAVGDRMVSSGAQPCIIRFGIFDDDSFNLVLRKRGSIVKLPRQQLALLLMLTDERGSVSRNETHRRIWGPDTSSISSAGSIEERIPQFALVTTGNM